MHTCGVPQEGGIRPIGNIKKGHTTHTAPGKQNTSLAPPLLINTPHCASYTQIYTDTDIHAGRHRRMHACTYTHAALSSTTSSSSSTTRPSNHSTTPTTAVGISGYTYTALPQQLPCRGSIHQQEVSGGAPTPHSPSRQACPAIRPVQIMCVQLLPVYSR